jgi:hypothetical protein
MADDEEKDQMVQEDPRPEPTAQSLSPRVASLLLKSFAKSPVSWKAKGDAKKDVGVATTCFNPKWRQAALKAVQVLVALSFNRLTSFAFVLFTLKNDVS